MPRILKKTKLDSAVMSKFSAQDRARLQALADREERALGTIVRRLALQALDDYEQSLQPAATGLLTTEA